MSSDFVHISENVTMLVLWIALSSVAPCYGEGGGGDGSHFLQPIVIDRANLSQMYTNQVNHTTEYLYDLGGREVCV